LISRQLKRVRREQVAFALEGPEAEPDRQRQRRVAVGLGAERERSTSAGAITVEREPGLGNVDGVGDARREPALRRAEIGEDAKDAEQAAVRCLRGSLTKRVAEVDDGVAVEVVEPQRAVDRPMIEGADAAVIFGAALGLQFEIGGVGLVGGDEVAPAQHARRLALPGSDALVAASQRATSSLRAIARRTRRPIRCRA
jgi:hypothetical protein